jgi:hypothetical protein
MLADDGIDGCISPGALVVIDKAVLEQPQPLVHQKLNQCLRSEQLPCPHALV